MLYVRWQNKALKSEFKATLKKATVLGEGDKIKNE